MRKGLADEAISAYRRALAAKSGYADAHYNLGVAFIKKDMHGDALNAFKEFIKYCRPQDSRLDKAKETIGKLQLHLAGRKR